MENTQKLFKQQIKKLFKEGKHIGVLINTESAIRKPLLEQGLSASEILNDLRYLVEKEYFKPYDKNPDNTEQITLTAKGQDWLEGKAEPIKLEKVKWYYNPWLVIILGTIFAMLILYYIFGIK